MKLEVNMQLIDYARLNIDGKYKHINKKGSL